MRSRQGRHCLLHFDSRETLQLPASLENSACISQPALRRALKKDPAMGVQMCLSSVTLTVLWQAGIHASNVFVLGCLWGLNLVLLAQAFRKGDFSQSASGPAPRLMIQFAGWMG